MPSVPAAVQKRSKRSKRSRNGCFSCKKLKIKCNEAHPTCEYCAHTQRICVYPPHVSRTGSASPEPRVSGVAVDTPLCVSVAMLSHPVAEKVQEKEDQEETYLLKRLSADLLVAKNLSSPQMKSLNSMQQQMSITRFEQKLLKFYLDFGGAFFTGNKNADSKRVFEIDVPRLWKQSPLIKNSIYAIATMYLWRFYKLNHISNIYLAGDQYLVLHTNNDPSAQSLFEITDSYIQKTFSLLQEHLLHINLFESLDEVGSVILGNIFLFTVISVHPVSANLLAVFQGTSNYLSNIIQLASGIFNVAYARSELIDGSIYDLVLYRDELLIKPPPNQPTIFPFIAHLRSYINAYAPPEENPLHCIYQAGIDEIEGSCFRAVKMGYVLPILRCILGLSKIPQFVTLLSSKDYIAMKIMYYYCAVISICGIKMFMEASLWDSYVEEFRAMAELKFGGRFEEKFDAVMYNHVHSRIADSYKRKGKPFLDPEQIMLIGSGKPLDSNVAVVQAVSWP